MAASRLWSIDELSAYLGVPVGSIPGFGTLTRPYVAFGGDNRGWYDPNGSFRTRMDVRMTFDNGSQITLVPSTGETKKYACRWANVSNCELTATKYASNDQLWLADRASGPRSGRFTFKMDAKNPLQRGAPAITAAIKVNAREGGTTITGRHDRMPIHEFWFTVEGWNDWYFAYGSGWYRLGCLMGSIPRCTAKVNVRL